eukprot:NODE_6702_length_508_cov_8.076115_g6536_i0.p1 GENE.NODE_6702_length_508_cov_8.076115_g6536_i0~~NODE_6702_length_508_cov_8.076115_g6536_i0.p1  ORF type:complete len:153 (+),score=43.71 NODE_6702_length_508_cov_8.076115_g6536_i0:63-461(+)
MALVTHTGCCHCGAVRFEFDAPPSVEVWRCNCSICRMKQNAHIVVPKSRFRLLSGEKDLSVYTFHTHTALHKFCRICGVQSFYHPRSNPDGIGVTYACVSSATIHAVVMRDFDGQDWEGSITTSAIASQSKL